MCAAASSRVQIIVQPRQARVASAACAPRGPGSSPRRSIAPGAQHARAAAFEERLEVRALRRGLARAFGPHLLRRHGRRAGRHPVRGWPPRTTLIREKPKKSGGGRSVFSTQLLREAEGGAGVTGHVFLGTAPKYHLPEVWLCEKVIDVGLFGIGAATFFSWLTPRFSQYIKETSGGMPKT